MSNSVYTINKGINKPIEFKGLKAQYIWYLGGGILGLLVLFAILIICSVNTFLCLLVIGILGTALFLWVYRLSDRYGAFGMMKKLARRSVPRSIRCYHHHLFQLKK